MSGFRQLAVSAQETTAEEVLYRIRHAEELGHERVWLGQQVGDRDISLLLSAAATRTERIGLGFGILPIYLRHPAMAAQMSATLDELSGGRFVLGLGLANAFVNEYQLGLRQGPPLRAVREYTSIVRTLLREGRSDTTGREFTARLEYGAPRRPDLPIYLAALRPKMIRLAVELGDGLMLWLCSARHVAEEIMPHVRAACAEFGKDPATFPVIAAVPTCVTPDLDDYRDRMRRNIGYFVVVPHYRRLIEAQGFGESIASGHMGDDVVDALTAGGDEDAVRAALAEYRSAGCEPAAALVHCSRDEFVSTAKVLGED